MSVPAAPPRREEPALRLGHMSNLFPEKGIDTTVALLEALRRHGITAKLIIAGPTPSPETAHLIETAKAEFSENVEYRGAVEGAEKRAFFRDIDVFVFPSRYPHEVEPLVMLEAMGQGVPVLAYDRGCIGGDLADAGISIPPDQDFITAVLPYLTEWAKDRTVLRRAGEAASRRAAELRGKGRADLDRLIKEITG